MTGFPPVPLPETGREEEELPSARPLEGESGVMAEGSGSLGWVVLREKEDEVGEGM